MNRKRKLHTAYWVNKTISILHFFLSIWYGMVVITRCDLVAYGQGMQKTLQRFFCSKKRNQQSRLITIDKNVAILLTELFFILSILPLPLLGSVAAGHRTIRFFLNLMVLFMDA
jgi:hypothetical protein